MMRRIFIDLEICSGCGECRVNCGYFYHPHNKGIVSLYEYATFATVCRQCIEAPCVNSCYHNALEKQTNGILKRYSMRCSNCKSCAIACPFGVIIPEFISYICSHCDYCVGRSDSKLPECVISCPRKAVELKEITEEPENNIFLVEDRMAVHSVKWNKLDWLRQKK